MRLMFKLKFSKLSIIPLVLLTAFTRVDTVYAKGGAYQSGYNHGVSDAQTLGHWYITQPGKGFAFHSQEFVRGYVDGFCATRGGGSSDADQAIFDCSKGSESASW